MNHEYKDVLISIQNVGLSYGGRSILAGLSAEVRDIVRPGVVTGQIIGVLGPSGVGKTQLSRIMTGLQEPTSGEILVGGKKVAAGVVGYVAQNYPLLRHKTVLGNLKVAARRAGASGEEAAQKSNDMLSKFGLADKALDFPAELSGGQRQRIAIAQQLLCSEHFLILDEPTTGLDPIMKDKVCDLIKQVASLSEENTIFVVTHDIAAILAIADHLWLLGRVYDDGSVGAGKGVSLGAKILYQYDLIERGLAWQERPQDLPVFAEMQREVRERFATL